MYEWDNDKVKYRNRNRGKEWLAGLQGLMHRCWAYVLFSYCQVEVVLVCIWMREKRKSRIKTWGGWRNVHVMPARRVFASFQLCNIPPFASTSTPTTLGFQKRAPIPHPHHMASPHDHSNTQETRSPSLSLSQSSKTKSNHFPLCCVKPSLDVPPSTFASTLQLGIHINQS